MATLAGIMREPVKRPFRLAQMKRRNTSDGLYETSWFDITKFVEKWGSVEQKIDDVRLNQFLQSGIQLTVRNDFGEFNTHTDAKSLWNGFLPRNRTLVRIQAGYTDGSSNQFPTDATQGIFILDGEIIIENKKNTVKLGCKSIVSPFQDTRADEITGFSASMTASEVIEAIRDHTDGSGNFLFRQFVTSTAWTIQSTTSLYDLSNSNELAGLSTFELIVKMAEAESFVFYPTRTGGLNFSDRTPATTASQFSFFGAYFRRPNIIKINTFKEATNKLFTHIRFKYVDSDTESAFVTAGTNTVVSPTSLEWRFGRKTLEFENIFVSDTATAENLVTNVLNEFSNLRSELSINTVFHPDIEILDRINVSHRDNSVDSIHLWDRRNWAADTTTSDTAPVLDWASETSSALEFNQKNFKVLFKKTNLDTFVTTFNLRESENTTV